MKKKLCLLMALVCCVAVFAVAFAACNDEGEGKVDLDEKFLSAEPDDIENALWERGYDDVEFAIGAPSYAEWSISAVAYSADVHVFIIRFADEADMNAFLEENAEVFEGGLITGIEFYGPVMVYGSAEGVEDVKEIVSSLA